MAECEPSLLTRVENDSHCLDDRLDNVKSVICDRPQLPLLVHASGVRVCLIFQLMCLFLFFVIFHPVQPVIVPRTVQ